MDIPQIYTEDFKIRSYETGTDGRVTVQSICNYLQEAAGNHATLLGVAVDKLFRQNLTWVLSRIHVQMNKYPYWRQKVLIETWPSDAYGMFAIRDFILYDEYKNIIGHATTSWMLLDFKKMRPISMPDFIMEIERPERSRSLPDKFDKLPHADEYPQTRTFNVRMSDLDMNNHVNNVHYMDWALETIPPDFKKKNDLSGLEISFRAESNFGDRILSGSALLPESNSFLHRVSRENDGRELAVLRTTWQPVQPG